MKRHLSIIGLCVLANCTGAPAPPTEALPQIRNFPAPSVVKAERDEATKKHVLCLDRAAKRLDDHKSDPSTIAHGMMSACDAEFEEMVRVYSQYLDDGLQGREKVARAARQAAMDGSIQIILKNRANKH